MKSANRYCLRTSLATFIFLPLLVGAILSLSIVLSDVIGSGLGSAPGDVPDQNPIDIFAEYFLPAILLALVLYRIYRFGKEAWLPDTFVSRYGPFIAPILFNIIAWIIITSFNGGYFPEQSVYYGLFAFLPFFAFLSFSLFPHMYWVLPLAAILSNLAIMACFAAGTWRSGRLRTTANRLAVGALALVIVFASAAGLQGILQYYSVLHPDPLHPELLELDREARKWAPPSRLDYEPFSQDNRLVSTRHPSRLRIDRDYPRLDGAAALIPLYAAAANAIYVRSDTERPDSTGDPRARAVAFSETTPAAYRALLEGKADMIFAGPPSSEQTARAAESGISFTVTPIAREAFVFLVNEQNPVTGLTTDQIRDIYSGKVKDWKEVGGTGGSIIAFQRNEGSGSQNAMLTMVMRGTTMRKPLKAEYEDGMLGLLREVAAYRNLGRAIGYSFRYYATVMNSVPGIRLLAIDGIAPTPENIRNGTYPLKREICIITARPLSDNASQLRDWFLSAEGQQLIDNVGYVSLAQDPAGN